MLSAIWERRRQCHLCVCNCSCYNWHRGRSHRNSCDKTGALLNFETRIHLMRSQTDFHVNLSNILSQVGEKIDSFMRFSLEALESRVPFWTGWEIIKVFPFTPNQNRFEKKTWSSGSTPLGVHTVEGLGFFYLKKWLYTTHSFFPCFSREVSHMRRSTGLPKKQYTTCVNYLKAFYQFSLISNQLSINPGRKITLISADWL